jgi:hypothetical protein
MKGAKVSKANREDRDEHKEQQTHFVLALDVGEVGAEGGNGLVGKNLLTVRAAV